MNGWIKLHRQTIYNEVWKHDRTAWHVFEALLLLANPKNGKWSGGRKQLAEICEINENTLYNALKRLEAQQMVNRSVNRRYTVYSICNWESFQEPRQQVRQQSINNPSTTGQHSYKNKNKNIYRDFEKTVNDTTELSDEQRQNARKNIAKLKEQFNKRFTAQG